jgi:glycosyltransferase involved in cell wall biosynthesis
MLAAGTVGKISNFHVMDVSNVPVTALTEALSKHVDTTGWAPKLNWFAGGRVKLSEYVYTARHRRIEFSLQRGYQYNSVDKACGLNRELCRRMANECHEAATTALICTSPYWAVLADLWPGPVVYYSLDYTYAYDGFSPRRILGLEKRLCRKAVRVFPVSRRIGAYLVDRAECEASKITLLPNATLARNVQLGGEGRCAKRPDELKNIDGPIAGVIGNMADNIDWILLRDSVAMTPWLYWVFVGPTDTKLSDSQQSDARKAIMMNPKARFLGARSYDQLQEYARALDAAVMPYRRKEPTYSGSSTRFYEHLAAGRPMIATRNVEELQEKVPLVRLVNTAEELVNELTQLRGRNFCDGWEERRIRASRYETWDVRAQVMLNSLTRDGQENRVRETADMTGFVR